MKTFLHDGTRMIELRRGQDCSASDSVIRFGSPDLALLFLRKCKNNGSMALLRRFAAYSAGLSTLSRMNDHQVLQLLARKISDQQIKIVVSQKAASSFKGGSGQPLPTELPPLPPPSVARPAPLEPVKPIPAPPPIEEAVFVPVDAAMQAATLKSAAQSGVPFCEECAKARSA